MRVTWSLVPLAGLTLAVVSVSIALVPDRASGAPAPSREITLIDRTTGFALVLQVEALATDAGAFVFRVPGRGLYTGVAGEAMRVHSPRSVTVKFEGAATLTAQVDPERPAPATPGRVVVIELLAQVDHGRREAEATLRDGDLSFHLNTRRGNEGTNPARTLDAFEAAIVTSDWIGVHALINRDLRNAYTAEDFASVSEIEAARVGRFVALHRLGVSEPRSNDAGARWLVVAYRVQMRSPAGVVFETLYDAYFILESEGWKLWYTAAR